MMHTNVEKINNLNHKSDFPIFERLINGKNFMGGFYKQFCYFKSISRLFSGLLRGQQFKFDCALIEKTKPKLKIGKMENVDEKNMVLF